MFSISEINKYEDCYSCNLLIELSNFKIRSSINEFSKDSVRDMRKAIDENQTLVIKIAGTDGMGWQNMNIVKKRGKYSIEGEGFILELEDNLDEQILAMCDSIEKAMNN